MIRAEINLKTIRANIKTLQRKLLPGVKICAVVKANAYSLGDTVIAPYIQNYTDWFAVANIREAARLRACGITKPILLLGVCEDFRTAVNLNLTISIGSLREFTNLSKAVSSNEKTSIHIKVNTGMNRYGITSLWQLRNLLSAAQKHPNIKIDGLYTHMAYEEDKKDELDKQLKLFRPYRKIITANFPCAVIHAASSGSAAYQPAQFDMVRVGKLLYGGLDGYRTALKGTSNITAVQNLAAGARIGYGGTETVEKPTTAGIVPCGYADIAHFNFSGKSHVIADGKPCKVLGRVCMDSFMIDITGIRDPLLKPVTIISDQKGQTIMDISRESNTIACELLCSLNFARANLTYKK